MRTLPRCVLLALSSAWVACDQGGARIVPVTDASSKADADAAVGSVVDAADASEGADASDAADAMVDATELDTQGLVLRYAFDEGAGTRVTDSSGHEHDGTLELGNAGPSAPWGGRGRTGGALAFGVGTDVAVPSGVFAGITTMTIGVWVDLDAAPVMWSRIFDFGHGTMGTADRWTVLTPFGDHGGLQWDMFGGSIINGALEPVVVYPGTQLPTNVWKHVAVTASGADYQMFVDGFPAAEVHGPVVSPADLEPLAPSSWLGRSRMPQDKDAWLSASLDELRVYDRVLSASEIADLAWPGTDYSSWRFDEGAGTIAVDSSDNAIVATLSGGAGWTASGRLGAALDLHGGGAGSTGPQVTFASNPLARCASGFTVAAWVEMHALTTGSRLFEFGAPGAGSTFVYLAPTDGTGVHFGMGSTRGVFDLASTAPLPVDGAWHHVAITFGPDGTAALYLAGKATATGVSTQVTAADLASAAITQSSLGASSAGAPFLDGAIDELRIACRAYTNDEIANLAHGP